MSRKIWIKLVTLSVIVLLFVVLLWQNHAATTSFRFLFFTIHIPQILLLLIVFALGFVTGIFATFRISAQSRRK